MAKKSEPSIQGYATDKEVRANLLFAICYLLFIRVFNENENKSAASSSKF